jgi:DNA-binding LacI/PurR family transcriptional regulator
VLDTERRAGVAWALAAHGLVLPEARFGSGDFSLEARRVAAAFVALPRRPTAVICASN